CARGRNGRAGTTRFLDIW
nr:immunoglobulin heavy chain junction region [Macaca mulatta]MOW98334.1 immunoglobulin heavy chain junction region [Macaca mulatta]MOW99365.1 immunoglobulin heavy chain junction region [Macaca mulatta]MOW99690.1 immunoglobulin heavy chain junction region [Macaca mulatta]MOX00496.1 immunoglobulin heavy chain junction region [Macaca mulatta]